MSETSSAKGWTAPVAILAALILFLGINLLAGASLRGERADLTEDGLYTLSDGTKTVLEEIDEPVRLRLYYSRRLGEDIPAYGVYAERVLDLLRQYEALAKGGVRLDVIDPEPFSEAEDRAVAFGLQGVPIDQSGAVIYFGLVGTNALDAVETIPFFQPEREARLEYDLTQMVSRLAERDQPVVGIMTDLPIRGGPGGFPGQPGGAQPWVLFEQLDEQFDTRPIPTDATVIDDDVRVLLVVHPQGLGDQTVYAMDQFVMRGGRLALFLDPLSEAQQRTPPGSPDAPDTLASDLPRLLAHWGITYDPTQGAGDAIAARRVAGGSGAVGRAGVDYYAWLALDRRNFGEDLITADLQQMNVGTAGFFALDEGSPLALDPLLTTSPAGGAFDVAILEDRPDPDALAEIFAPDDGALTLAGRLTGPLETAFPDGPPTTDADSEGAIERPGHRAATEGAATILLIADTDLLQDQFWVNAQNFFGQRLLIPVAQNAAFVANIAEALSGSDALISLRSRTDSFRPFTLIQDLEREAESRFLAEERALRARLEEAESQLADLRQGEGGDAPILTEDQRAAIERFQQDLLETRGALREVQRRLNADVERTQTIVEAVNIVAVPAMVIMLAILLAWGRARRRRAAAEAAS